MSALPENPTGSPSSSKIPQNSDPRQTPKSNADHGRQLLPPPGQQSQFPQRPQNDTTQMAPPEKHCRQGCKPCDIRTSIATFGFIHLILQFVVIVMFRGRYVEIERSNGGFLGIVKGLNQRDEGPSVEPLELQSQEFYLAIVVYSGCNAVAAFFFICAVGQGVKSTCSVCYIIGLILNLFITGSYWRIVPSTSDYTLEGRNIAFNISVFVAAIYHACGFVFIRSIGTRKESQHTGNLDLESGFQPPTEIYPTGNPSSGFQQQSTSAYPQTATIYT